MRKPRKIFQWTLDDFQKYGLYILRKVKGLVRPRHLASGPSGILDVWRCAFVTINQSVQLTCSSIYHTAKMTKFQKQNFESMWSSGPILNSNGHLTPLQVRVSRVVSRSSVLQIGGWWVHPVLFPQTVFLRVDSQSDGQAVGGPPLPTYKVFRGGSFPSASRRGWRRGSTAARLGGCFPTDLASNSLPLCL